MTNRPRFAKNLTGLAEIFDKELSTSLQDIYWQVFESIMSDDEFESACNRAAVSLKFWPKPVELRDMIKGDDEAQALEAWEILQGAIQRVGQYQSVTFTDSRITRVVEIMGGWETFCLWEPRELNFGRREFIRYYQTLGGDAGPPRVMAGLIEKGQKRGDFYWLPRAIPVVVGDEPLQIEEDGQ